MDNRFDNLADSWDAKPQRLFLVKQLAAAIRQRLPLKANMKALDYGTGTGLLLMQFQPDLQHITGMDNSQGMLNVLKQKLQEHKIDNVSVEQHDIEKQKLPKESYDLVISSMTLHHISDPKDFFTKIYQSLKPDAMIALVDLLPEDGDFHSKPDESIKHLGFEMADIKAVMQQAGYENIVVEEVFTIERELADGSQKNYPLFLASGKKAS